MKPQFPAILKSPKLPKSPNSLTLTTPLMESP